MSYLLKFKSRKNEIIWTFICTCILIFISITMFLYNRYIIYVKNLEIARINLTSHLNYTYRDKFYGDMNVSYDVKKNMYNAKVDFYIPNEQYVFNLSSRGNIVGDGYLHNNKDNLISHRFARQLKDSLVEEFKEEFPEIFKVYTEMQVLKGKYDYKEFYSKEVNEPHIVHLYLTSKNVISKRKFLNKVNEIGKFLVDNGYKNLNNVHVNYVVRKEAPALYYSVIDFDKYSEDKK